MVLEVLIIGDKTRFHVTQLKGGENIAMSKNECILPSLQIIKMLTDKNKYRFFHKFIITKEVIRRNEKYLNEPLN